MANRAVTVEQLITPTVNALGYELVGCEWAKNYGAMVLRVYIDNANGIRLEDCERVSRQVSALLDVEEPISGRYQLEVSSPGLDRPLFTLDHYRQFIGCDVKLRLYEPINRRKRMVGRIEKIDEHTVTLLIAGEKVILTLDRIDKANLVVHFEGGIHE